MSRTFLLPPHIAMESGAAEKGQFSLLNVSSIRRLSLFHQAHKADFFLCPGDVIVVVVGLCPPVAGTATLRPETSQRCTGSFLVLSEKQPKEVNEKKQQYFNTSFYVFSNNHSFEEGQKTLTILSACIHHLISNIHSRCTLDEVKQKCKSID